MFNIKENIKSGFTLAEVLITIGIIGVVAALSVPPLIMHYQERVYETKLQRVFSVATNACERMIADDKALSIDKTNFFNGMLTAAWNPTNASYRESQIKNYFKTTKSNNNYVYSPDGTEFSIEAYTSPARLEFKVDLNGDKKPNAKAKDKFLFRLDANCNYYYPNSDHPDLAESAFNAIMTSGWKYKGYDR